MGGWGFGEPFGRGGGEWGAARGPPGKTAMGEENGGEKKWKKGIDMGRGEGMVCAVFGLSVNDPNGQSATRKTGFSAFHASSGQP